MKKIALYSPYLDTASGGEKYMLTIAEVLSKTENVEVLLDNHLSQIGAEVIKERNEKIQGLDLSKVKFIKAPVGIGSSFSERVLFLKQYNVLFYNTDGSLFYSTAKKNILHIQIPLDYFATKGIWGKIKTNSWQLVIYNSKFTKEHVQDKVKVKGQVVYPPVNTNLFKPKLKKNQILTVGRFAKFQNPKKQEIMIKAFCQMVDKGLKGWSLHLVGGIMEGNEDFLQELKAQSKGYPVEFHPNLKLTELVKLYDESSIYWHAMGYEEESPMLMEHFGISTVEAMAAGCVPVVINKGGQKEIVKDGENGYLWGSIDDLQQKTLQLVSSQNLRQKLSKQAVESSNQFSKENFEKQIWSIVND